MNQLVMNKSKSHLVVAVVLFLMAINCIWAGLFPQQSQMAWGTPAYAVEEGEGTGSGHGIDDLWGEISDDPTAGIGSNLDNQATNMETLVSKSKQVAQTVTSILTLIAFVSLLFWAAKLGMSAGNPQNRSIATKGILISGVALAILGGSWIVVSFFWNFLK